MIVCDLGASFTSKLFHELADILEIKIRHATLKHPQSVGLVERAHGALKRILKLNTITIGNNYRGRGGGGNNRYGRDFYDRNQGSDGRNFGPAWNQGNQGFSGGPPAGNFYQPWFPAQHVPYFQPTPVICRNCGGPNHTERDCAVGNQNANRYAQVPIPMMQGGFSNQQKN